MRASLRPEGKPSRLDFRPFVRPPLDPDFHQAANERPPGGLRQSMRELSNSKKVKIIKRRKG